MTSPMTDREIDRLQADSRQENTPIARSDRLSTTSATYGTVVSWTVAASTEGNLTEVALTVDNFGATQWRLSIGGVVQFTDRLYSVPVALPWGGNVMAAGTIVLLEARSPDGATAIVADGTITGTER